MRVILPMHQVGGAVWLYNRTIEYSRARNRWVYGRCWTWRFDIPFTPGLELEEHLFKVAFACFGRIGERVKWHIYMDLHDVNYPL